MGKLRDNIKHYMALKGIKSYSTLLADIARESGIKGEEAYKFAEREKSNFSKMLNGERPLKYNFIIPLEKIFGVSLARLMDEEAYKLPAEKDNVPFDKGFRYYAYKDDPKLYREEFDLMLAKNGKSVLTHPDEFGKTFLDYAAEYNSVNGVRYLHEEYGMRLKWHHNNFEFRKDSGITWVNSDNCIAFARLVAGMNDEKLFNDIYDTYNMFLARGDYVSKDTIFCKDEYLEIMLDNDALFRSMFKKRTYEYVPAGRRSKKEKKVDPVTYRLINPIINNCLRYALEHLDKYRDRAVEILRFGIKHNNEIINEISAAACRICNELGGVMDTGQTIGFDCHDIRDIAVYADTGANDDEINVLIRRLPKFSKMYC